MLTTKFLSYAYLYNLDWLAYVLVTILFYFLVQSSVARTYKTARMPWQMTLLIIFWVATGLGISYLFGQREEGEISRPLIQITSEYSKLFETLDHYKMRLDTPSDDPNYLKLIDEEKNILKNNNMISDVYTLRLDSDNQVVFMVDSETDYDRDGRYAGDKELRTPIGEKFVHACEFIHRAFEGMPTFENEPYADRWGAWVSAYSPIKNRNGQVEAVLGVDFDARSWLQKVLFQRYLALTGSMLLILLSLMYTHLDCRARENFLNNARNQRLLNESELRLQQITNQVPGMLYQYRRFVDGKQIFQYVSKGSISLLGHTPDEITRDFNLVWANILPEDIEPLTKSIELSAKQGTPWSYEFRMKRDSGEIRWMRGSSIPEKPLPDGSIIWNGILVDITFGRVLADALSLSEARNRMLIEMSLDAIIMIDASGRVINWNARAIDVFGWQKEEAMGQKLSDLIIPSQYREAYEKSLKHYLETGESHLLNRRLEMEALHRSGRIIPIELSVTSLRSDNGVLFGAFIRDITERKKIDEDRAKMVQLELLSEAKSKFIAVFSHEIRTPLNAIMGFSALLKDTKLDPIQNDYAATIHESGELLLSCINSILDFSKLEAGERDLDIKPFDLEESARLIIRLMQPKKPAQKVDIFLDYPKEVPRIFKSDRVVVEQILMNLVGNAKKFTESGRIDVTVGHQDGSAGGIKNLVIRVKDTGIGISPSDLNLLFKPFSQVDDSPTRKHGGTGLGLAITKYLVDLLGGTISVQSVLGKGSEFTLCFSLDKSNRGFQMEEVSNSINN